MKMKKNVETERMEIFLSYILLLGVSLSAFVIFLGIILAHIHPQSDFPGFLVIIKKGLKFNSYSLLVFGFLLLLATPIMRVLFSFVLFLLAKDWTYAFITLLVLLILLASLLLGSFKGMAFGP